MKNEGKIKKKRVKGNIWFDLKKKKKKKKKHDNVMYNGQNNTTFQNEQDFQINNISENTTSQNTTAYSIFTEHSKTFNETQHFPTISENKLKCCCVWATITMPEKEKRKKKISSNPTKYCYKTAMNIENQRWNSNQIPELGAQKENLRLQTQ